MRTCDYAVFEFDVAYIRSWYPRDDDGNAMTEKPLKEPAEATVRILGDRYKPQTAEGALRDHFAHTDAKFRITAQRVVSLDVMLLQP